MFCVDDVKWFKNSGPFLCLWIVPALYPVNVVEKKYRSCTEVERFPVWTLMPLSSTVLFQYLSKSMSLERILCVSDVNACRHLFTSLKAGNIPQKLSLSERIAQLSLCVLAMKGSFSCSKHILTAEDHSPCGGTEPFQCHTWSFGQRIISSDQLWMVRHDSTQITWSSLPFTPDHTRKPCWLT